MSTFLPQHDENSNNCNDEEAYTKRKQQRRPFGNLSSNTPSKMSGKLLQPSTQPLKPLPRSASVLSAPTPPKEVRSGQTQVTIGSPLSVFRSNPVSLDLDEMWTLKRASPVFDEEDEEEFEESPTKRVRTTFFVPFPEERDTQQSVRQGLPWDCKVREDENGFHLVL